MAKSDTKSSASSKVAKSRSSAHSAAKTEKSAGSSRLVARGVKSGGHITTVSRGSQAKGKTDWTKVDALTDEEIAAAVASDPDAVPLDLDWSDAVVVMPPKKVAISIRVDPDVLGFFKEEGPGYQRRINQVLRTYVEHRKKAG